ncbi:MAG TPA: PIN domain-containing protein [Acidobacteriaceae bacterium]
MNSPKRLVLDANILLRGVFGVRVRSLLEAYEDAAAFYSPDVCFDDARKYIPELAGRRNFDPAVGLVVLDQLARIVQVVDCSLYEAHEELARARISSRDAEDWPIVAASLLLNCPVWTEDQDFFGSGIATWTTNNIELYLRDT